MKPSTQQAVLSTNVGTATRHMRDRNRPENTPIINMGTLKEKPSKLLQETHVETRDLPGPWNPPPEARPKSGTVHTIQILPAWEQSLINNIEPKRRTSRFNPYIPLTVVEALVTISNNECTLARLNRLQDSNEGFGNIPLIFNEYHHAGRTTRGRIYGHNHPHNLWDLSYT